MNSIPNPLNQNPWLQSLTADGSGVELPCGFSLCLRPWWFGFAWGTVILGILLRFAGLSLAAEPAKPPNFILFIADDMGWNDCGAYGHPTIRTPNIDRLASEGMRFEQAYLTISSCSPSRASILTGRFPHNTGAGKLHDPLPADQVAFTELLREAGYWTAAAGKWHFGEAAKSKFDRVTIGGGPSGAEHWVSTLKQRPEGRPFCLWLAAFDPHRPYQDQAINRPHETRDSVVPPFLPDIEATRRDLARYYDEIARFDQHVGEVLTELERQGQTESTLVLLISDNGRPFPRCKTTLYDSGIKTPWIVYWPGRVKSGSVRTNLVSSIDIAPTLVGLAGMNVPLTFQGDSFLPLLENPDTVLHDYIYAEHNWHDFDDHARAVRSLRFKYIRNYYQDIPKTPPADAIRSPTFQAMLKLKEAGELSPAQMACFTTPRPAEELYDTRADPYELNNLAGDSRHANVLKRMRQALADWEKRTEDQVPEVRTPDQFDRQTGERLTR